MSIIGLTERPNLDQDKKLEKKFNYFKSLIDELTVRELPSEIVHSINQDIEAINSFSGSNKEIRKQIRRSQSNILKLLEKKLKIVPKNLFSG